MLSPEAFSFLVTAVVILICPGPTNALLATSGATVGWRRSLPLLLAEVTGYLISILTIGFVIGREIAGMPRVAVALKVVAGIYLVALALRMWKTRLEVQQAVVSFRRVFLTTLVNPKALLFALVVIPMHQPNTASYLAAFFIIVPIIGSVWLAIGSMINRGIGDRGVQSIPKVVSAVLMYFVVMIVRSIVI